MNTQRKYVIVSLLKGEAKTYHKNLVDEISREFEIEKISDKIDPHITLKYFHTLLNKEQIKKIESSLEKICKTHKKAKIRLRGIGSFENQAIYLDVKSSKEMDILYSDLVKELEKLKFISWGRYEKENVHFHSTIADVQKRKQFEDIFNYLKKETFNFELELDKISILTKPQDKWILYKEFLLQD